MATFTMTMSEEMRGEMLRFGAARGERPDPKPYSEGPLGLGAQSPVKVCWKLSKRSLKVMFPNADLILKWGAKGCG